MLSGERAPSSVITPKTRVLPLSRERGPSSAFSLDPERSPQMTQLAWDSSQRGALLSPLKLAKLRVGGMLDVAWRNGTAVTVL